MTVAKNAKLKRNHLVRSLAICVCIACCFTARGCLQSNRAAQVRNTALCGVQMHPGLRPALHNQRVVSKLVFSIDRCVENSLKTNHLSG